MTITRQPMQAVRIDKKCDKCGEGRMRPTGLVYSTIPPQYQHACDKCGEPQIMLGVYYPHIEYEPAGPET